ncbi:hypothetical protein HG531_013654 [Fusarium graminearum]|nr:hypothetical protein HG531_013654 [Fusarium graminearum]
MNGEIRLSLGFVISCGMLLVTAIEPTDIGLKEDVLSGFTLLNRGFFLSGSTLFVATVKPAHIGLNKEALSLGLLGQLAAGRRWGSNSKKGGAERYRQSIKGDDGADGFMRVFVIVAL